MAGARDARDLLGLAQPVRLTNRLQDGYLTGCKKFAKGVLGVPNGTGAPPAPTAGTSIRSSSTAKVGKPMNGKESTKEPQGFTFTQT